MTTIWRDFSFCPSSQDGAINTSPRVPHDGYFHNPDCHLHLKKNPQDKISNTRALQLQDANAHLLYSTNKVIIPAISPPVNYSCQTLQQMMGGTPWLLSQVLVKPWLELHPPATWGHPHFYNSSMPLLEPLNFYTHTLLGLAAVPLFGLETWCPAATLRNHLFPF